MSRWLLPQAVHDATAEHAVLRARGHDQLPYLCAECMEVHAREPEDWWLHPPAGSILEATDPEVRDLIGEVVREGRELSSQVAQ